MFGYVLPARARLSDAEWGRFQSIYCGLCRTLKTEYGAAAELILNYDLTFLAILLSAPEAPAVRCRKCAAHPCRGCSAAEETEALRTAAAYSVILAWWQLRDGVADSGFFRGLRYRLAAFALRRAYRKAAARRPEFDAGTRAQLTRLDALERSGCRTLDEPADAFASLLAGAADGIGEERRRRVLREILYHLGRWIYLVDAADDLKKDLRTGSYNPLALRYALRDGKLEGEARKAFSETLDHSVRQLAAAFELWDFGCWQPVLQSTFYAGLYQVGNAVLAGTFQKPKRRTKKRKDAEDTL